MICFSLGVNLLADEADDLVYTDTDGSLLIESYRLAFFSAPCHLVVNINHSIGAEDFPGYRCDSDYLFISVGCRYTDPVTRFHNCAAANFVA